MMKKTTPLLLATLAFIAIGCNQKTSKNTSTSSSDQYNYSTGGVQSGSTTNGSTTGTTTSGSTTGTTTSGSTTGTTTSGSTPFTCNAPVANTSLTCTDFDSARTILPTYTAAMAGQQTWGPGLNPSGTVDIGQFPTVPNMVSMLQTDSSLSVRFRVNAQPQATVGREYCYGRPQISPGSYGSTDTCTYSKLKFKAGAVPKNIYESYLANPNGVNISSYLIDITVAGSNGEGIMAGKCTQFYELPHVPNQPYVIVITDVRSDNNCRATQTTSSYYNYYCPNNTHVRKASCWSIDVQAQTDTYRL